MKEKSLKGDQKLKHVIDSALAGGLIYGVVGPMASTILLVLLIFLSLISTPMTKNQLINIGLRTLAFIMGAIIIHIFIYLRLRYNF